MCESGRACPGDPESVLCSTLPLKCGGQFDVGGPEKLIDRLQRAHFEAAIDQDPGIAGKTDRVAGNRCNFPDRGFDQLLTLGAGAGTGWIKQHAVDFFQFHV